MKKSHLFITVMLLLFLFVSNAYSHKINFSTSEKDTSTVIYNKIPDNGILDKWLVLGPIPVFEGKAKPEYNEAQTKAFDTDYINPSKVSKSIKAKKLVIKNSAYNWKIAQSNDGIIDLIKEFGDTTFVSAYAFAQVNMAEDKEFLMGVGSDDAVKIWINQNLVHSNFTGRGVVPDNDLVPIKLRKGNNEILVKVQNMQLGWGFTCRLIFPSEYTKMLMNFTKLGMVDNINQLLRSGANVNAVSELGLTPLQTAKLYGQRDLINFFLSNGADSTIRMPSKDKIIDTFLSNLVKKEYPGAAVLISRNGKIFYNKAFGFANLEDKVPFKSDTKFRISSTTKPITAAAILKLQEQGLLNVNDNISKYFPDFPRGNEITIHHLLSNTSGLPNHLVESYDKETFTTNPNTEDLFEKIKKIKFDFKPNEMWGSSNCGYYLLSEIIEKISGLSYQDFLKKTFFDPLGMPNSGIHKWNAYFGCEILNNEASGYSYENGKIYKAINLDRHKGADALYSNMEDLFKWNEAVFNNKALNEASLKAAFTPVVAKDGSPSQFGFDYGYGWLFREIHGQKAICHGGALFGYDCELTRLVDKNINIIVFFNRCPFPDDMNSGIATDELTRIYLWDEM